MYLSNLNKQFEEIKEELIHTILFKRILNVIRYRTEVHNVFYVNKYQIRKIN